MPFEGLTPYRTVNAGSQEIKVVPAGGGSPIIDTTTVLTGGQSLSYILFGTASTPVALLVQDGLAPTATGQFGVRITNAAIGSTPFDAYVTAPGVSLDGISPNLSNVAAGTTSTFVILSAGQYQVRFTLHNSKQLIYDAGTLTFAGNASYAFVAYSKASGTLVNAALLVMDTNGNGALANSTISEFKLVHAAPLTAAINARVNGNVAFANVPYQGITSYGTQGVGTQTVTIEAAATPGAVIASAQPPFSPATDTSIVVTGLPGAQTALVFADNNLPGTIGSARMRVANVAPGLGAVDVLINFSKRVSGLATNTASTLRRAGRGHLHDRLRSRRHDDERAQHDGCRRDGRPHLHALPDGHAGRAHRRADARRLMARVGAALGTTRRAPGTGQPGGLCPSQPYSLSSLAEESDECPS